MIYFLKDLKKNLYYNVINKEKLGNIEKIFVLKRENDIYFFLLLRNLIKFIKLLNKFSLIILFDFNFNILLFFGIIPFVLGVLLIIFILLYFVIIHLNHFLIYFHP